MDQPVPKREREQSSLSALLEEFRARKGWTYRQVTAEIAKQTGVQRNENTVRFCIQGHAGNQPWNHKGLRRVSGKPSTLELVCMVLGVPKTRLRAAVAQDLLAESLDTLDRWTDKRDFAYTGGERRKRTRRKRGGDKKRPVSRRAA